MAALERRRSSAAAGVGRRVLVLAVGCAALRAASVCFASGSWAAAGRLGRGFRAASSGLVGCRSKSASVKVSTEAKGDEGTTAFRRIFVGEGGKTISPWHDLPLDTDVPNEKWMVTEITKMTKPKMEIATKEEGNPIAQDIKKGKLRDYHGPIFWNYGCFPQTWEDPSVEHPELKVFGDNDPLDVVEIGSRAQAQGEVSRIKVLGALAMIDDGELDWKIIAIDCKDPLAGELQSVADVEAKMPGVVSGIREWFRWYKTPDGKPLNGFGFKGETLDATAALGVVAETHEAWVRLRSAGADSKGLWTGVA